MHRDAGEAVLHPLGQVLDPGLAGRLDLVVQVAGGEVGGSVLLAGGPALVARSYGCGEGVDLGAAGGGPEDSEDAVIGPVDELRQAFLEPGSAAGAVPGDVSVKGVLGLHGVNHLVGHDAVGL